MFFNIKERTLALIQSLAAILQNSIMTIPVNRKRFPIVMLVGLSLSFVLCFLFIDSLRHFNDKGYNNSIYLGAIVGVSLTIFSITFLSALDYIKTMFDKTAALTITDDGLNDNLSIFSVGNVSWAEVTDIKISSVLKTDFLIICVTNPQMFIDRKNIFKRKPLKSFLKKFGSPVVISQKRVDYNLKELKNILLRTRPK